MMWISSKYGKETKTDSFKTFTTDLPLRKKDQCKKYLHIWFIKVTKSRHMVILSQG